jgi:hypothetical protein
MAKELMELPNLILRELEHEILLSYWILALWVLHDSSSMPASRFIA